MSGIGFLIMLSNYSKSIFICIKLGLSILTPEISQESLLLPSSHELLSIPPFPSIVHTHVLNPEWLFLTCFPKNCCHFIPSPRIIVSTLISQELLLLLSFSTKCFYLCPSPRIVIDPVFSRKLLLPLYISKNCY